MEERDFPFSDGTEPPTEVRPPQRMHFVYDQGEKGFVPDDESAQVEIRYVPHPEISVPGFVIKIDASRECLVYFALEGNSRIEKWDLQRMMKANPHLQVSFEGRPPLAELAKETLKDVFAQVSLACRRVYFHLFNTSSRPRKEK